MVSLSFSCSECYINNKQLNREEVQDEVLRVTTR